MNTFSGAYLPSAILLSKISVHDRRLCSNWIILFPAVESRDFSPHMSPCSGGASVGHELPPRLEPLFSSSPTIFDEVQSATVSFMDRAFGIKSKMGFELRPSGCRVTFLTTTLQIQVSPSWVFPSSGPFPPPGCHPLEASMHPSFLNVCCFRDVCLQMFIEHLLCTRYYVRMQQWIRQDLSSWGLQANGEAK